MKINAQILVFSFLALGVMSCKKQSKQDLSENKIPTEEQLRDELLSEARKIPLTTLAIPQIHHNFGDLVRGQQVEHTYTFTNTGDQPLVISAVKPACGCTAPDFTNDPILPGKEGKVTLRFDSSSFGEGLQNKFAEVFTNTEVSPVVISFSANIIR